MSLTDNKLVFAGASTQEFHAHGRFLRIRDSVGSVFISIDGATEIEREQGEQIDTGKQSTRVRVRSAIPQTVIFICSSDRQDDDRANANISLAVTIESGNDNNDLPKVSVGAGVAVKVADINLLRKSLRLSVPSDAAGFVTIGKSTVTAIRGGLVEEGTTDYIDTTGEIWVFNPNAVAVDVYVMEINKI